MNFYVDRKIKSWNFIPYEKDTIVEHDGKFYIGVEERNFVEPNDLYTNWLYVLF